MAAKKKTRPLADPDNTLGQAYADALRLRAQACRTKFLLSLTEQEKIAKDLEVLAELAERHPEVFGLLKRRVGG
jgi:hypothetical protein